MSATLTLLSAERGKGNFIEVTALIVLAGNYVQGGVVCDLTSLYGQADPLGRNLDSDALPLWCSVQGQAQLAAGQTPNTYDLNTYTNPGDGTPPVALTPATCKLAVYAGVTEANSAGYINNVLSDRIIAKMVFPSQR